MLQSGARASARQTTLRAARWGSRPFHATRPPSVKAGDRLPDVDLVEGSPGNKVNLARDVQDRGLVIGVPAAFSPSCSASHVPGFLQHPKLKDAGKVFVISVNDAFVMKAWGASLDPKGNSGIRFLGDPSTAFTKQLDLILDAAAIFGGDRSKRYALKIEGGRVKEAYVEPDGTGVNASAAEKVLG